jgi:PIN domain nuclease of toxin-antitoxin system
MTRAVRPGLVSRGRTFERRRRRHPRFGLVRLRLPFPALSATAKQALDGAAASGEIYLSAISLIELTYLVEKGRLSADVEARVSERAAAGGGVIVVPVDVGVARALATVSRDAIPDMPDRIVAATATHLGLPLVSRDGRIQASAVQTIW